MPPYPSGKEGGLKFLCQNGVFYMINGPFQQLSLEVPQ